MIGDNQFVNRVGATIGSTNGLGYDKQEEIRQYLMK